MKTDEVECYLEKGEMWGINLSLEDFLKSLYNKTGLKLTFVVDEKDNTKMHTDCIVCKIWDKNEYNLNQSKGQIKITIAFRQPGTRFCLDHIKWTGFYDFKTQLGWPDDMVEWPEFFNEIDLTLN